MKETNEILIYQTKEGDVRVDVIFQDETFWMPQKTMAELFDVDISIILENNSTIGNFPIVQQEGNRKVTRNINFYNLDAIIAVGYRVNSYKATQFFTPIFKKGMIIWQKQKNYHQVLGDVRRIAIASLDSIKMENLCLIKMENKN